MWSRSRERERERERKGKEKEKEANKAQTVKPKIHAILPVKAIRIRLLSLRGLIANESHIMIHTAYLCKIVQAKVSTYG